MEVLLTWLGCALAALASFTVLASVKRPFLGAVVAAAAVLAAFRLQGLDGLAFQLPGYALVAVTLVYAVRPLRRALVTRPLFPLVKSILPKMSETEKAALDAGTVGWDGELFSGAPRMKTLLDAKLRDLDERERAFLREKLDPLCARLDDDAVTRAGNLPRSFGARSGLRA